MKARRNWTLEQGFTFAAAAALVGLAIWLWVSFPRFEKLENRTEMLPSIPPEAYLLPLNASKRSFNLRFIRGRHPFMPAVSYRIRRTPRRTRRTPRPTRTRRTPRPTPKPTRTPPPRTPSLKPTPPPFELPVTFAGTYRESPEAELKVILMDKKTGRYYTVGVGEKVAGMKVLEITPVSVVLRGPDGRKYVLKDPNAVQLE